MDKIRVVGGRSLNGVIPISGSKNGSLPLMIASLLTGERLRLSNVPRLVDIRTLTQLLAGHGVTISESDDDGDYSLELHAARITNTTAPYELVSKMRASFCVLGPLVARCGEARVSLPGGCAIGARPVDLHLKGLEAMGAKIELVEGYVHARAPDGLHGAPIRFPVNSVGATTNLMMAATLARGETVLANAAREPEIADLANCLVSMGARIEGIGTETLVIEGVQALSGATHAVPPDRIEAGTYAIATAMAGGDVLLKGVQAGIMDATIVALREAGIEVASTPEGLHVQASGEGCYPIDVKTEPYPGFATDFQAQIMALLCRAQGESRITETIFENRFMHVQELARMGADITVHGDLAIVRGVEVLRGAPVMATDLRASVCLIIAALAAKGETLISRVYHLDRGFERLEEKLSACGAEIERLK